MKLTLTQPLSLISILMLGVIVKSFFAEAADQALLDALVKNGFLTQEQAQFLAHEAETEFAVKSKQVEKITFNGRLHIQYDNISVDDETSRASDPSSVNSFILRRIYLGAKADLKNDWSGTVIIRGNDDEFSLDKAFITKEYDDGKFDFGFRKVRLGYEENTSSSKIKTVERSLVTRYFTEGQNTRRLGVGGRHIGILSTPKASIVASAMELRLPMVAAAETIPTTNSAFTSMGITKRKSTTTNLKSALTSPTS